MVGVNSFHYGHTIVTSTTTAALLTADDPVLIHSTENDFTGNAYVGGISSLVKVTQATSATTATNISSFGFTTLGSSSGPITTWLLDAPRRSGITKTITSIATSTANKVTTESTASANFVSTSTWLGTTITFQVPGDTVKLVSLSTSQWLVTDRTGTVLTT